MLLGVACQLLRLLLQLAVLPAPAMLSQGSLVVNGDAMRVEGLITLLQRGVLACAQGRQAGTRTRRHLSRSPAPRATFINHVSVSPLKCMPQLYLSPQQTHPQSCCSCQSHNPLPPASGPPIMATSQPPSGVGTHSSGAVPCRGRDGVSSGVSVRTSE